MYQISHSFGVHAGGTKFYEVVLFVDPQGKATTMFGYGPLRPGTSIPKSKKIIGTGIGTAAESEKWMRDKLVTKARAGYQFERTLYTDYRQLPSSISDYISHSGFVAKFIQEMARASGPSSIEEMVPVAEPKPNQKEPRKKITTPDHWGDFA